MQTNKTVKIGKSVIDETTYNDFLNRYETHKVVLEDNEETRKEIKSLKHNGFKVKYRTVSFSGLTLRAHIELKAIGLRINSTLKVYDPDLIEDWLKW